MFQFHNGTINTGESEAYAAPELLFQFHNGTINTFVIPGVLSSMLSFNSTTVQLIQCCDKVPVSVFEFQFHNGTINTGSTPSFRSV